MIILDTNVLSEMTNPARHPAPMRWLDSQNPDELWTTVINAYELRFGVELLPAGKRRAKMMQELEDLLDSFLELKIVPLEMTAVEQAARLAADRRRRGVTVEVRDVMIAGIAISRQATLATRNVRHFDDLPVPVVNPWEA